MRIKFTRHRKLKTELESYFSDQLDENDIKYIIDLFDEYEKDNLDTIEKLKRKKQLETKRITGGLRQTINAHGPITKILIGSASKRIYGALLSNEKPKENILKKIIKWITK